MSVPTVLSSLASAEDSNVPSQETSTKVSGLEDLLGSVAPTRTFPTQDPDYLWAVNTQIRQQLADSTADALVTAADQESARLAELATQASQNQREASSSAFVNASPQAARDLLNQNFGEIIQAASSTPLDAIQNEQITAFRGSQVATLEAADDQPAEIAVSTTPMRVPAENGRLAPIDLDLTSNGGSWTTRNGQVDLTIPTSSSGTVEVGPVSFDVGLPGQQTSNSKSIGESARFYPEIGPDTDMVISATSEGAEAFFSLRSPLSAERQTLYMDIPAGARLTETSAGSFEVASGDKVIARVPAPVAFDSNGTSVPVEATVDGGALSLTTEHRGEDLAYPILVDPIIDTVVSAAPTVRRFSEVVDSDGNLVAPYGGWYAVDDGGSLDNYAASGAFGDGLYLDDPVAMTRHGGVWIWVAPPGSTELTQVDFGPYGLALNGDTSSAGGAMILGMMTGEGTAAETHAADVSNGYTTVHSADGEGAPSPTDFALFGLVRIKFGSTVGDNDHSAYLGGAVAHLSDPAGARLTGELGEMGTETIDGGWTNSSDTMTIPMQATDSGLGVKKLEAFAVDENDETVVLGSYVDPCLGGAGSPCPETLANDVDLDMSLLEEGRYTIKFRAYDALIQTGGGPSLTVGIDRTAPHISTRGSIVRRDGQTVSSGTFDLTAIASDSQGEEQDGASGVASLQVELNGSLIASSSGSCDGYECAKRVDSLLAAHQLDPGFNQIEVVATDQVENKTTRDYTLTLKPESLSSPQDGDVSARFFTLNAEAPGQAWDGVTYQYRRDPQGAWNDVPASDVRQADDGETVAAWPVDIDSGGETEPLIWDAWNAPTLGSGGAVELRAVFVNSLDAHQLTSDSVNVTLDRSTIGSKTASAQIGPGTVNLISGNFTRTELDVSVPALGVDLAVSRTYSSRAAESHENGPFGPGWLANLSPDGSGSNFTQLNEQSSQIELTTTDGTKIYFQIHSGNEFSAEGGYGYLALTKSGSRYRLRDLTNNGVTEFAPSSTPNQFVPATVRQAASPLRSTITFDTATTGETRVAQLLGPQPKGVDCDAAELALGCRSLVIHYATSTTATGTAENQLGDYVGRLRKITFMAGNPASGVLEMIDVAKYEYDSLGRLRAEWDPRISPALRKRYSYTSNGLLEQAEVAGLAPWLFSYTTKPGDLTAGRLASVSRDSIDHPVATQTVAYDVPLSGEDAPHQMDAESVGEWAQTDLPAFATAIFGPSNVPSGTPKDFEGATIHYLNGNGQQVNVADPEGGIGTSEYDENGTVWRELTPANRKLAREESDSAGAAILLDTRRTFSDDGLELLDELGPLHTVELSDGRIVEARAKSVTRYDEDAPGFFHLETTNTFGAYLPSTGEFVDKRTVKYGYANGGWKRGTSTSYIEDPAGLNLQSSVTLAPDTGFEKAHTQPNGHSRATIYYTATANSIDSDCGNKPMFAGLVCKQSPGAPPSGDLPAQMTTKYTYDMWFNETSSTETNGTGDSRTISTTFDALGRPLTRAISATQGTSVPPTTRTYYADTGLLKRVTDGDGFYVEHTYDDLGRETGYRDADGNETVTTYGIDGRMTGRNDGKATQLFEYDDNGQVIEVDDSLAGVWTGEYDPGGRLARETSPNGLETTTAYDEGGSLVYQRRQQTVGAGAGTVISEEAVIPNVSGKWSTRSQELLDGSVTESQSYRYDQGGRLTHVKDYGSDGSCNQRLYTFDQNGNRLTKRVVPPTSGGACGATNGGTVTGYTYDSVDRLIGNGTTYDSFGRTTNLPHQYSGGGDLTVSYHENDRARSIQEGSSTTTFGLDPMSRTRILSVTGKPDTVQHYGDDSDVPIWTTTNSSDWTRMAHGLGGSLSAIQTKAGSSPILTKFQITSMHGDVIGDVSADPGSIDLTITGDFDEFGVQGPSGAAAGGYGWLGAQQRSTVSQGSGIIAMGARLYVPGLGRFLQVDPVYGGSLNDYDYAMQDPVNMNDLFGENIIDAVKDGTVWVKDQVKKAITCATQGIRCVVRIGKWLINSAADLLDVTVAIGIQRASKTYRAIRDMSKVFYKYMMTIVGYTRHDGGFTRYSWGCLSSMLRNFVAIRNTGASLPPGAKIAPMIGAAAAYCVQGIATTP